MTQQIPQPFTHMFQYQPEPSFMLLYGCNFLEQLQGIYKWEIEEGPIHIHVLMPILENQSLFDNACTIVRRVGSDGDALSDQIIFEEPERFILCSLNQKVLAYLHKGWDSKNGLTWTAIESAYDFFWQRMGHETLVPGMKLNRSMLQTQEVSSLESLTATTSNPETILSSLHRKSFTQKKQISNLESLTSTNSYPDAIRSCLYNRNFIPYSSSIESFSQYQEASLTLNETCHEQKLFELIKASCFGRPNLLKKVVNWGLTKDKDASLPIKMSSEFGKKLTKGRVWVSCMLKEDSVAKKSSWKRSPEQDAVDILKGAYQETTKGSGVYVQPCPEAHQPSLLHCLRKENKLWIIEERDPKTGSWKLRAKEGAGSYWLDIKNVHQPLKVKIIPMCEILERMTDCIFRDNIETYLNFLFQDCNQKKLNTKLKERTLKHTIHNLEAKLEKQECLTFAVWVVRVADEIAKEYGIDQ